MPSCARNSIYHLTSGEASNWRELLEFGQSLDLNERRQFLWAWPTANDLHQLKEALRKCGIESILSVGCGNGLLEWLLRESGGVANVYGLEVDSKWWQSNYAIRNFVDVQYVDDTGEPLSREFLQQCCRSKDWNFALLFCYFNNRAAFLEYLRMYQGQWLLLIGPRPNIGLHTDPNPLQPNFTGCEEKRWQLCETIIIDGDNVVAIYKGK